MRATIVFALLCLAMLNLAVVADEAIPRVKIEEFSIQPREAHVRDEIRVTCTVRNVGSQPVTVHPQINLTVPGWTHYIKPVQPPQKLEPGDAFTFTGASRPDFDYTGDYLIQCEIRDPETKTTLTGLVDEQPLRVFRLKQKTPPETRPSTPGPSLVADADRPFYFVGETVSIHGRVANPTKPIESLSLSGAVYRQCPVGPDGTFTFEFSPSNPGVHEVVLKADGLPTTTVSIFATAGEVEFPALFGTDRTYEVGFFLVGPGKEMPMLPVWAHRLGVKFIAFPTWSAFHSNALIEETLNVADRLGVTVALGGDADCASLGLPRSVFIEKSGHRGLHYGTNMLSQEYQEKLLATLTGLASDLRHHPSFRYALFLLEVFNLRIDEGYDAENLERFTEEVLTKLRPSLTLPPTDKPQAWFDLLYGDDELWENWLLWRERIWTDFMVRLRDAVKAIKPDLEIGTCETTLAQRGLFNVGMLAERGLTVHAPHTNFPIGGGGDGYWTTMITRDWYRLKYGFDSLFISIGIWDDVQPDPEQITSGLFGPIKAGGTRIPAYAECAGAWDYEKDVPGFASFGSVVTDMIKNASGGRKVKAFESAVSQITRLPYKDRFAVYERNGNRLPLEFAIHWTEDDRELSFKSIDGIRAGTPYDAVYTVVQDWHPNGYTEILVFNDVEQRLRTHRCTEPVLSQEESYTFEPGTLRKRTLTVTAQCDEDIVPFVDGRPWLYYERQDNQLIIKSIPFDPQQIKLLQLVRCGQSLPYIASSQSDLEYTTLNTSQRRMWLRLLKPAKDETHTIKLQCAPWNKPNDEIRGGRLESFDTESAIATILVDKNTQSIDIQWPTGIPR